MPYDPRMAERAREVLQGRRGLSEKKMFGGVGFLLHGNMCVGVWREYLILRLGPEQAEDALREPFVKPFDITGRAMSGWVMVESRGLDCSGPVVRADAPRQVSSRGFTALWSNAQNSPSGLPSRRLPRFRQVFRSIFSLIDRAEPSISSEWTIPSW